MRQIKLSVLFDQTVTGFSENDVTVAHTITSGSVTFDTKLDISEAHFILTYDVDEGDEAGGFVTFNIDEATCQGSFGNLDNEASRELKVTIPAVA